MGKANGIFTKHIVGKKDRGDHRFIYLTSFCKWRQDIRIQVGYFADTSCLELKRQEIEESHDRARFEGTRQKKKRIFTPNGYRFIFYNFILGSKNENAFNQ